MPDLSYWYLKFTNKKYKNIKKGNIKNLKLNGDDEFGVSYYTGETLNGVPFGKGFSEKYNTHEGFSHVFKKLGKKWTNKYNKNFSLKLEGYFLEEKFIGEWYYGMWHGKGEQIEYDDPSEGVNYDGTPKIRARYIGKFEYGKKEGLFKVHSEYFIKKWVTKIYKNNFEVRSKKK